MDQDEGSQRVAIPMILDALAMQSPRVRAAVHRHITTGEALVPLLREAHGLLLQDAAALMAVAGAAPFSDTPTWPEGEAGAPTEAQLLALVAAADRRELACGLVTRRTEAHSVSMLPRERSH